MKRQILSALAVLILASFTHIANATAADVAAGKAKTAACAGCHGTKGISAVPLYPNLAGQKEAYLVKQIKAFKTGVRKDPAMSAMVKALSDTDIANVAAYYASLK